MYFPLFALPSSVATIQLIYERTEKFKVLPFVDLRSSKKEIAKNTEGSREKPVTTKDDVAMWCTDRFKTIIKQYGLTVVDNQETVTLKGEILNFYVTEDN